MSSSKTELIEMLLADAGTVCERLDLSFLRGKSVLVTGASGLLGTHFLASLKAFAGKGNDVETVAVTRSAPPEYINALLDYGGSRVICGDLADDGFIASLPKADVIIHAAG